jgi:TPR repeat protein
VAQDYAEVARPYRVAAAQGHARAQTAQGALIGILYVQGEFVAQDYAEAARLYRLAAQQGIVLAADALKELSSERAYVAFCCTAWAAARVRDAQAQELPQAVQGGAVLRRRVPAARVARAQAALQVVGGGRGGGAAVKEARRHALEPCATTHG